MSLSKIEVQSAEKQHCRFEHEFLIIKLFIELLCYEKVNINVLIYYHGNFLITNKVNLCLWRYCVVIYVSVILSNTRKSLSNPRLFQALLAAWAIKQVNEEVNPRLSRRMTESVQIRRWIGITGEPPPDIPFFLLNNALYDSLSGDT